MTTIVYGNEIIFTSRNSTSNNDITLKGDAPLNIIANVTQSKLFLYGYQTSTYAREYLASNTYLIRNAGLTVLKVGNFTTDSNGKITYRSPTIKTFLVKVLTNVQNSASTLIYTLALYKNGSIVNESECRSDSTVNTFRNVNLHTVVSLAQGDYLQLYHKVSQTYTVLSNTLSFLIEEI